MTDMAPNKSQSPTPRDEQHFFGPDMEMMLASQRRNVEAMIHMSRVTLDGARKQCHCDNYGAEAVRVRLLSDPRCPTRRAHDDGRPIRLTPSEQRRARQPRPRPLGSRAGPPPPSDRPHSVLRTACDPCFERRSNEMKVRPLSLTRTIALTAALAACQGASAPQRVVSTQNTHLLARELPVRRWWLRHRFSSFRRHDPAVRESISQSVLAEQTVHTTVRPLMFARNA
jgi:hypothetical protein